jgi:hypothetical protein
MVKGQAAKQERPAAQKSSPAVEKQRENLKTELAKSFIDFASQIPDHYRKLGEKDRKNAIDNAENRALAIIQKLTLVLASDGFPRWPAIVPKIGAVPDDRKLTFSISVPYRRKGDPGEDPLGSELVDALMQGRSMLLVMADITKHTTGGKGLKAGIIGDLQIPEPDEKPLVEHMAEAMAGDEAEKAAGYPPDWPRCPVCGEHALDGHITCGRVECDETRERHRRADAKATAMPGDVGPPWDVGRTST